MHFLEIYQIAVGDRLHRRDGHQSPDPDMGQLTGQNGRRLRLLRGKAALGLLAADVHLQQDILHQLLPGSLLLHLP